MAVSFPRRSPKLAAFAARKGPPDLFEKRGSRNHFVAFLCGAAFFSFNKWS